MIKDKLSLLVTKESSDPMNVHSFEKTYLFLKENPQLGCLEMRSIFHIKNIKNPKRQASVIKEIVYLISHPKISDYRVMKIISSSKGEDVNG